jgi:3-mercaptopropionate dioxygenase
MAATETRLKEPLISRLDAAVAEENEECRCEAIKQALEDAVASGERFVPEALLQPAEGCYARRLLHRDPQNRYTVLVMVWGPGQGTSLHDHAGTWCVECVYQGTIRVVSYDLVGTPDSEPVQFQREKEVLAGPGQAGALIPPFEYHTIENAADTPSATIHVYGGELKWCHIFVPTEGGFRRELRELCYTD